MIKVRVDDFPQTKGEPQHTLQAFREFDRRLRECIGGRRYLLGVIPGRCSVDDILFLRNETDCVIGMHGTDHDEQKLDRNGGNQFEPYLTSGQIRQQLYELRGNLQYAVGRPVRVYMPPRNVIDKRTADVLHDVGFDAYTGGPETSWAQRQGTWKGDNHVACEYLHSEPPHEYGRTDEMWQRGSHEQLRLRADDEDTIITLHWTWETNIGLQHMTKFLTAIPVDRFTDFDV